MKASKRNSHHTWNKVLFSEKSPLTNSEQPLRSVSCLKTGVIMQQECPENEAGPQTSTPTLRSTEVTFKIYWVQGQVLELDKIFCGKSA